MPSGLIEMFRSKIGGDGPPAVPRQSLMLATGIECSYPTVEGGRRRDQLEETRHYQNWREDLELCVQIGAKHLRYGPPYYRIHTAPHRYDWSFTDEVLPRMRELGLVPILDLCHFGVPDWAGDFQNEEWPELFADFAGAFARRYPWIRFYTPVNEILVCARFSGKLGWWNEQQKSDAAMIKAHANQCRATLLAIEAILPHRPDAVFIQSEAAEVFLERWPATRDKVRLMNQLRFITFDFLYGRPPDGDLLVFLLDNGATREMYEWFMAHGREAAPHCVMGMDYYDANERVIDENGDDKIEGAMLGWSEIARDYYRRYRRPMMLTETNSVDEGPAGSVSWLHRTWHQVQHLRREGIPVLGYTWYSLTDQVDWDIQLRETKGHVVPNRLFTLDRRPRAVARAFKQLADHYGASPLLEDVPVGMQ